MTKREGITMVEHIAKLLDQIAELKEYKHQVGEALARIEYWQQNVVTEPNNRQTLEKVLDIFKEEIKKDE